MKCRINLAPLAALSSFLRQKRHLPLKSTDNALYEAKPLRDYSLNLLHPEGKHKTRVFAGSLGFSAVDAEKLGNMILGATLTNEATAGVSDEHGDGFVVDFSTQGLRGIVTIRTAWIIDRGETVPRLVSCYVKRK